MSSTDHHPVQVLRPVDVTDAPPTAFNAALVNTTNATGHPPFDELLAGLHQMILYGQALRHPDTRRTNFKEDSHGRG